MFLPVMPRNNKKSTSSFGVRYTDAQKQEIVKFVADYNAAKGRGGQSAAVKKYKTSPITITAWIKAAGTKPTVAKTSAKTTKASTPAKAPKAAKASKTAKPVKKGRGVRYAPEKKKEVVDFVAAHNKTHGRGGQSKAAKKFKLSMLTVASWLKNAGLPTKAEVSAKSAKVAKRVKTQGGSHLLAAIGKVESALEALKASIKSSM